MTERMILGKLQLQNWYPWFSAKCQLHELSKFLSTFLIRPRKIVLPSARPILFLRNSMRCLDKGLVSKSASWSWVCTCRTWRVPFWTRSRTKWRSIWMCFILECCTRLKLIWVAPRLSQRREGGALREKPSSWNKARSHIVSDAAFARALYSASVDERATALCFLELQEIGFEPRKVIYVEVEVWSSLFPA